MGYVRCYLFLIPASGYHVGSLKEDMVGVCTPQKSAEATNQGLIYCFVDCLKLKKVMERILILQIRLKNVSYQDLFHWISNQKMEQNILSLFEQCSPIPRFLLTRPSVFSSPLPYANSSQVQNSLDYLETKPKPLGRNADQLGTSLFVSL